MTEVTVATREDFEAACAIAKKLALDVYTRSPDLPPAGLVFTKDDKGGWSVGLIDMALFFSLPSAMGKQLAVALMNKILMEDQDVLMTCLLSEAWRVERPAPAEGEPLSTLAPSEDPNRIECLMVNVLSRESQAIKSMDINRSGAEVTLTERELVFVSSDGKASGNMVRPSNTVH